MTDCDHCGASFDDETAYLKHLRDEHPDDLGRIEQRRIDSLGGGDGGVDAAPVALGAVLVAAVAIVAYVVFFTGGSGGSGGTGGSGTVNGYQVAQLPTGQAYQGTHYHGQLRMAVQGDTVDFSQQQYQLQAEAFHFEGDGRWHVHAPGVTLEFAMATLSIGVTDDSVTYEGTTYTDGEGASVQVLVNGNDVDPASYVLQDGDRVEIVVE
jgi:hypothetical protein